MAPPPDNCPQLTIPLQSHSPNGAKVHLDHERLMDCIHCGLCLSQCPTYAEEGLEADSPRGRIYLMRGLAEGRTEPTPDIVGHLDLCLGCRACETACPSGVQYGHLLEGTRAYLRETYKRPWLERTISKAVESIFPYPNRLEAALLPVRVLRRTGVLPLLHRIGFMKALGKLGDMEATLPKLPPMQHRLRFPQRWGARGEKQASVGMITGCVMQVMQSPVNEATARVLAKAGCDVAAPIAQVCCGALHAHIGAIDEAKALAKKNIEVFEAWEREHGEMEAIIINAAGCGSALKEYAGWFKDDAQWSERARQFTAKIKDVSEFLAQPRYKERLVALMESPANVDAKTSVAPRAKSRGRLTYHDACHLAHGQGIRAQPRELIATLDGCEIVPLGESEMCCGSAGIYNITQPEMAMQLLERKMKHIAATGADTVVTGNPGCLIQIQAGAAKFGVPVEVVHPIELLDSATNSKGR